MAIKLTEQQIRLMVDEWGFSELHIRFNWEDLTKVPQNAIDEAQAFVANFTVDKNKIFENKKNQVLPGLFLESKTTGTGKTTLVHLIAKDLLLAGKRIRKMRFLGGVEMMFELKRTFASNGGMHESEVIDNILEADLFILDDLDKLIKWSEYEKERATLIFDKFYTKMTPVIITSNKTLQELTQDNKLERHLYSRFVEMCKVITIESNQDFRTGNTTKPENGKKFI